MNHPARKVIPMHHTNDSSIRTCSVESVTRDIITVNIAGDIKTAKKAFSCIIDVNPGDIVICADNHDGNTYILGIIERPGTRTMNMSFPGDAKVQTMQGSLQINAHDSIGIASANVNCFSKKVVHKSHDAIISYEHATAEGHELQASFKTVQFISNLINTMARQVISRFKGYIRHTEGSDMVNAGQMTQQSRGLFSVDAKHTIMNSRESTKIDGKKILMG